MEEYKNICTKPIIPLRAELTLGDSFSNGTIFDSLGFRGIKLESDDNMLPDSMRGFAPTIKGIANKAMLLLQSSRMVLLFIKFLYLQVHLK